MCIRDSIKPIAHVYGGLDLAVLGQDAESAEADALRQAREWLSDLKERHGVADADATAIVGVPALEIKGDADAKHADLIVTGSHGRHGIGRVLGSTANGVLHAAPCDVLVVRI